MIATAPIRGASADVQLQAAVAQKEFWELMTKDACVAYPSPMHEEIVAMNGAMAHVISSQERLIAHLDRVPDEALESAEFAGVIDDLECVVSASDKVVRAMFNSPVEYVRCWQPSLQKIADLSGHIDNYTEMFRVAMNENCSAVLAHLATNVLESRAV